MTIDIPLYINHSHRCAQAALKGILRKVLPGREFSYKDLDELTLHAREEITFPSQIALALLNLNVPFEYFVKEHGLEDVSREDIPALIRKAYGGKAEGLIMKTNVVSLRRSVTQLLDSNSAIRIEEKPSWQYLEQRLREGRVNLCLINFDVFAERENNFAGHYIVLTDVNSRGLTYNDCGPIGSGKDKWMSRERFQGVWQLCFFDHDLLVI